LKIIPKLTLALVSGTCVVLAFNGYLRVRRERTYFEAERIRNHEMIGRSLGAAAAAAWKSEGEQAAIRTIDAVKSHFTKIQIRWVPSAQSDAVAVDREALAATPNEEPVTRVVGRGSDSRWKTYVPLDIGGARQGVIELSEPATNEKRFLRGAIADTIAMAAALAIVSAVLSFTMSQWLVGVPVRALAAKARRVGRGDFSGHVSRRQHDELADLAREMNAMSDHLLATMEQLRHADRLATVGKLASGVAHELGTPLNVVGARAGMIASGEVSPEESRDYARVIAGAADRMTKTIRRLLLFARREGVKKESRDLRELTKETLEMMRPLAAKRAVRFETAASSGAAMASVDPAQIQQVITNLVMNAIQAMPRGGMVVLTLREGRGLPTPDVGDEEIRHICLLVADDGEGISPENLPHIFEPFFTTKDIGEGTGLGLAVTYGIIREHGGWVSVDSTLGKGTTFSVFLPLTGDA
jgi:two-component system NtrC family sensor kinase